MSETLMWGTANSAAETVAEAALKRAEAAGYTLLLPGEWGGTPELPTESSGNVTMPVILAARVVYAVDGDHARAVAIADGPSAGSPEVLEAIREERAAGTP